jgi:hypothetical protein
VRLLDGALLHGADRVQLATHSLGANTVPCSVLPSSMVLHDGAHAQLWDGRRVGRLGMRTGLTAGELHEKT